MKFTIVSTVLGFAPLVLCSPVALVEGQTSLEQITDNYLFNIPRSQFSANREVRAGPSELVWDSDECTHAPELQFKASCQRHDFGYRNYAKQKRLTEENKARIDTQFKNDLYNTCAGYWWLWRKGCKAVAKAYYKAVKHTHN